MKKKTRIESNLNTAIQKLQQIKSDINNQPILQYELEQIIRDNTVQVAVRMILSKYTLIGNDNEWSKYNLYKVNKIW